LIREAFTFYGLRFNHVAARVVVQYFSVHPGVLVKRELRYGPYQNIVLTDAKGTI